MKEKYIHNLGDFSDLFEKLKFSMEENGTLYSAAIFVVKEEDDVDSFRKFLLKNLRITDTIFSFYDNKTLVVLEDTSIKGTLSLEEKIREKIEKKGLGYNFYSSAIQGDYIDTEKRLYKALKKRLDIAKERDSDECIHSLDD